MRTSKILKKYALSMILPLIVFFAFAGTLAGTFAWYTYITKVAMTFGGTAISSGEQLQVGLVTDLDMSSYDMDTEVLGGVSYAWVRPGRDLSNAAINAYSRSKGYATTELEATTSGKYATGDELALKRSPTAEYSALDQPAYKSMYQYIPLVFRLINAGTIDPEERYLKNKPIWLYRAEAQCETGDIENAMRIYMDGNQKFIMHPTASSAGTIPVAGLLDINEDGYFDSNGGQEIVYGSYSGTPDNTFTPTLDTDYHDINGTGITTKTTFTSRHKAGNLSYNDFSGLTFEEQEYLCIDDIKPVNDGSDGLSGGVPVCTTGSDINALARLDLKIFLEGWDHAAVDAELNNKFTLGLQFQINRA